MAKIEYNHPAGKSFPSFTETIEARVWSLGGTEKQPFYIGGGLNFRANGNIWLELIYSVEGTQVFYTRNFLHHGPFFFEDDLPLEARLDEFLQKGEGEFTIGDILPETTVSLILKKYTYPDENGQMHESSACTLMLSSDAGAVFGRSSPGMRYTDIRLQDIDQEEAVRFLRDLIQEIQAVQQGQHPDPASFPVGSSEWSFAWKLNQVAYDRASNTYHEDYFKNELLNDAFNRWVTLLPPGARVLDAGCGHGQPVISRLLEEGFQVTGSDLSPEMLLRAASQFPRVTFIQKPITMIADQAAYDGICSFNSMLYLDPIDLLNSIHRLHHALKPGGHLFLFAFDSGPDWRGEPFGHRVGQWMWSWHYGMEEAAHLLEEHGYFEVLDTRIVQTDKEEAKRIAREHKKQKKEEREYLKRQKEDPEAFLLPFFPTPIERSPYAYVVIARRRDR